MHYAGKDSLIASLVLRNKYSANLYVDTDAVKLIKRLDGLPLALIIARVYLK
jgi:hypothetical protein